MAGNDIDTRVHEVEKKQVSIETKLDDFIQEMRDFKNEMRQQNEMRARETMDLRSETDRKFEQMEAKFDQRFTSIETKIDSVNMYAHQMFIAAAIGIGAMILTVVAPLIISAFKSADAPPNPAPQAAVQTQVELVPSVELPLKD